jgi:tRNA-binding EMAP/Myf-like protein
MIQRVIAIAAALAGLTVIGGCSATGAGSSGFGVAKNLMRKDTNLRVYLDGEQAKQSTLAKGLKGYSPFTIKEEATTSPVFKYEIIDPKKFGFIKSVMMAVHQKFEADFSDLADYKIFPRDTSDSEQNMKPGVDYDLGNLGPDFKILDKKDKEVEKVEFVPGVEYLLVFTISADKSETIQIYFKTK